MNTDDLKQRANDLLAKMQPGKLEDNKAIVSELEELYQQSLNEEIALSYASGLFNLTIEQDLSGKETSVKKIEQIYSNFSSNKEIALMYVGGLVSLTIDQDLSGRETIVKKIEQIYSIFPLDEKIAHGYVAVLDDLTFDQDLSGIETSVKKIEQIYSIFSSNEKIVAAYANGLFNLHRVKKSIDDYISKNEKLISEFPSMAPILEAHKIRFLIINNASWNSHDSVKKKFETSICQVNSRVVQEYEQIFGRNLFVDVMDSVFYKNFDGKLISFCLESFAHNLEGTQYEIFIDEDFKKFNDEQKEKLYELQKNVKEMLHTLTFTEFDKKIGHYTSVETLKNLLTTNHQDSKEKDKIDTLLEMLKELQTTSDAGSKKKVTENNKLEPVRIIGKSRFSNANYMNDTEEGEVLDKTLGWERNKETIKASKWYLMSLTTSIDDLSMWAQYGEKGEGVALVFNRETFSSSSQITDHQLLKKYSSDAMEQEFKENQPKDIPYRICYLEDVDGKPAKPVGDLFKEEELKKISAHLDKIRKIVKSEDFDTVADLAGRILEEIRYLFKSADYQYEKEIRLLKYVPYTAIKKIKQFGDFPPRLYIEADNPIKIDEIIFGPKVSEVSNYVPYIKWCDEKIKVSQSKIHFR